MQNHLKKISVALALLIVCIIALSQTNNVFATASVGNYTPLAPILTPGLSAPTDLTSYLQNLFLIGIGLAGAMAVFMIVLGGVQYMSTDAIGKKGEGKIRIQNALEGLALVILCWVIMYTINPKLVGLNFSPSVTPSGSTNTNTGTNTNNNTNTNQQINKCPITVRYALTGQQYMIDNSAGASASTAESKVTWWEKQKYTTTGTNSSGGTTNGCYKIGQNYCVSIFASGKFMQTDCSAGTNPTTCEGKKRFYEDKNAFTASYTCSYQ